MIIHVKNLQIVIKYANRWEKIIVVLTTSVNAITDHRPAADSICK